MQNDVHVHPNGLNESDTVGAGTRIWAFAHVMKGAIVGRNCNIGDHAFIESGAVLGDGVAIKNGVCVWEGIVLDDFVFIGPNATLTNDRYPRSPRCPVVKDRYEGKEWLAPLRIERGASIGANATVVCGTVIGSFSMVGAGAVVTRDIPAHALVLGCPAVAVGWVCACGGRLTEDEGGFACGSCMRGYAQCDHGLRLVSGDPI